MTKTRYQVITFDCYGTLIDWESGIAGAFQREAKRQGAPLDRDQVLAAHAQIEPRVQSEGYLTYREVLTETACRVATCLNWSLPADGAGFLAESLPDWRPFPDTNPALEQIHEAGLRLGILSNIDDDLLEATCRHFSVPFDLRVTAQQLRSYKPALPHFLEARKLIGAERWLHTAQSHFHDVAPAAELGIPVAWINRKAEALPPGGPAPSHEFATLKDLADWVTR